MNKTVLQNSLEYKLLLERRAALKSLVTASNEALPPIQSIIMNFQKLENIVVSIYETTLIKDGYLEQRKKIAELLSSRIGLDCLLTALKERALSDLEIFHSLSNYLFIEYIFQYRCENGDYKVFRNPAPNEDNLVRAGRVSRRNAEEAYRNGQIEEALSLFKSAEFKIPEDPTINFQIALIDIFDRGDATEAVTQLKNGLKKVRGRSGSFEADSLVLMSFVSRLIYSISGEKEILGELYSMAKRAYGIDPSYNFAAYCYVQALVASAGADSGLLLEAKSILKELVLKDKFYAFQSVFDRALDILLPDLEALYVSIGEEFSETAATELFNSEEEIKRLEMYVKYVHFPDKVNSISKDIELLREKNFEKKFIDCALCLEKSREIKKKAKEMLSEAVRNKRYNEIKALVEKVFEDYNSEVKEYNDKYSSTKEEYLSALHKAEELYCNYPSSADELPQELSHRRSADDWRSGKTMFLIKFSTGCMVSLVAVAIMMIIFMFFEVNLNVLTYALMTFNVFLFPAYGSLVGEIYYILIENKKKNFNTKLRKLRHRLEESVDKKDEMERKLSEKYIKEISVALNYPFNISSNFFDAVKCGKPEKIRKILESDFSELPVSVKVSI